MQIARKKNLDDQKSPTPPLKSAAKVIFVCCFHHSRGLLSRERDMFLPTNIWSWQPLQ